MKYSLSDDLLAIFIHPNIQLINHIIQTVNDNLSKT